MTKILALVLLVTALCLTSCLDYESRIQLKPDGSGVLIETMKLNRETAAFLQQLKASGDTTAMFSFFDEKELREKATRFGEGVVYVSGKKIEEDGRVGYVAVYAFSNIEKLTVGQKSVSEKLGDEAAETGMRYSNPADEFRFSFSKGSPATLKFSVFSEDQLQTPQEEPDMATSLSDSLQDSYLRMMKTFLKGMKMNFLLEPQGTIVKTNAAHVNGSVITLLSLDFDELIRDDNALKTLVAKGTSARPTTMKQLQELIGSVPGIKAQFGEIQVQFK